MSTGNVLLALVMLLPARDSLNAMKSSARYVELSLSGRTMSFQANPVLAGALVGVNEVTLPLMSKAPKRLASRRPSRPKPAGVVVPVARVKLELMFASVVNEVTEAGFTLPLWVTAAIRPKPTVAVLAAPVP